MSSATCGVAVAVSADRRPRAHPSRGVGEREVVGTEVVSPLRDAVRLVDDEQSDLRAPAIAAANPGDANRSGAT